MTSGRLQRHQRETSTHPHAGTSTGLRRARGATPPPRGAHMKCVIDERRVRRKESIHVILAGLFLHLLCQSCLGT